MVLVRAAAHGLSGRHLHGLARGRQRRGKRHRAPASMPAIASAGQSSAIAAGRLVV